MRPVRFVALSEDGQALVLADEVGRLLTLPLDERIAVAVRHERESGKDGEESTTPAPALMASVTLSPRDIQSRIRAGESADDVARHAGVPVTRVLRYAGPVLQERAMLAQHARRARLRTSDRGARLADIVDGKLGQHGVDSDKVSWDAYRREDGTWRVTATWPSGKATAQAVWELDKARQTVGPDDEMAQFLSTEGPAMSPTLGGPAAQTMTAPVTRPSRDPLHGAGRPATREPARDPLRRDALRAVLERPMGAPSRPEPAAGGLGLPGSEPLDSRDTPSVPSLAVLRPRRTEIEPDGEEGTKPRNRLPAWDDVLFGSDSSPRSSTRLDSRFDRR
ncbi:DNA-binding protein [Actinorhabdospora filicis]|uniref:DNA-binding protein n=1 Tax=Actinorhabdospora filicis TaxID=1785913 RepID=A0A9W6STW0_9ACTN|nr:septation protein SepH [Actinorhabdospora filicis]GLZ80651.1 DNA-binding protein [Actinorhabdospora filicis]